jgi:sugar O-acyltransferase (sialic acid O-acetyltransferase NeuD family)
MCERFAIWGCAGHAKVLASLVAMRGGRVVSLFDNRELPSVLPGVPVFFREAGFSAWAKSISDLSNVIGLVAIGGNRGRDRMVIQGLFRDRGMRLMPVVHPTAFVCATVRLGAGTQVLAQAVVAADVRLGEVCIINHKASVDHECQLGDGVHVAPGATLCGCIRIGDNVMIGAGAVVLPNLTIGADATIGAGAVVTKDVPAGAVIVGNPGRQLSAIL